MDSKPGMQGKPIKRVVIAGGGTAGWMAAAAIAKLIGRDLDVALVESDDIPTVGVGEATIPSILTINRLLQIPEPEFIREVQGTFKLGIEFENWRRPGHRYIHSFGDTGRGCWAAGFHHFWLKGQRQDISRPYGDYCVELKAAEQGRFAVLSNQRLNYAYHLDAGLYGAYLRGIAEQHGVRRIEGRIADVRCNTDNGYIESLHLQSGQVVEGDLFIDCTGFRGLLIEQALETGFDDWSHWLPCNSAQALQTESLEDPIPYTRSTAREAGWQWRIPLQHRVGNGLVYCSDYLDDTRATEMLLANVEGERLTEPRVIKYCTGQRRQYWNKNCIALGLASGFIEPLESTSIHFMQNGVMWLMLMFPQHGITDSLVRQYNATLRREAEHIRDFIILHYHVTERDDTPFWDYCRTMSIPDSLQHRLDLFRETGRVFKPQDDVFAENSWVQVMMGQGITPEQYHPIVDMMSDSELQAFLGDIEGNVRQLVGQLPSHAEFVAHYSRLAGG
jgi:tryptophan halogenase